MRLCLVEAILNDTLMKAKSAQSNALIKSYIARAKLFYSVLQEKNLDKLFARVEDCASKRVSWDLSNIGISEKAFSIIKRMSLNPALIFCHPEILTECPDIIEYYRNISALSQKGMGQILSGKLSKSKKTDSLRYQVIAKTLNTIISGIIEDVEGFSISLAREALVAEMGAEIQGTWVNIIGQGAARNVEALILDYAQRKGFINTIEKKDIKVKGKSKKQTHISLKNGWLIVFSSEPDVSIINKQDKLSVAVEIKGSLDKAGAQTRLGEAKKSFAKAKAQNARCTTIYLASCFTDAVYDQLKTDREIDIHFNLVDILADAKAKQHFLKELFHYRIRIE